MKSRALDESVLKVLEAEEELLLKGEVEHFWTVVVFFFAKPSRCVVVFFFV